MYLINVVHHTYNACTVYSFRLLLICSWIGYNKSTKNIHKNLSSFIVGCTKFVLLFTYDGRVEHWIERFFLLLLYLWCCTYYELTTSAQSTFFSNLLFFRFTRFYIYPVDTFVYGKQIEQWINGERKKKWEYNKSKRFIVYDTTMRAVFPYWKWHSKRIFSPFTIFRIFFFFQFSLTSQVGRISFSCSSSSHYHQSNIY